MAKDRPGIVAAVSGAVADAGGNITHLSETVLRGYFTIILSLEGPRDLDPDQLRQAIANAGEPGEFQVGILPYEPALADTTAAPGERFVLTARCTDRAGIIHSISQALAGCGINIEDFYAYVLDHELIMILELRVTEPTDLARVRQKLDELSAEQRVTLHLQHEDIFRATTELQAVLRLGDAR